MTTRPPRKIATNVRLPPDLRTQAIEHADRNHTTLTALVIEGLELRLGLVAPGSAIETASGHEIQAAGLAEPTDAGEARSEPDLMQRLRRSLDAARARQHDQPPQHLPTCRCPICTHGAT